MRVQYNLLADQIGNLLSRMSAPRLLAKVGEWKEEYRDPDLDWLMSSLRGEFESRFEAYQITKACEGLLDVVVAVSSAQEA